MYKTDVLKALKGELDWHKENQEKGNKEQKDFIKGLRQAINLVKSMKAQQ